jgi:glycosyltransferase involved in cell wall biosynthesis
MPGVPPRPGADPGGDPCDLSVVLPAYNEARLIGSRIGRLRRHLARRGDRWEILVVDDGSTDGTSGRVLEAAEGDPRLRLVRLEKNRGKGAALAEGISRTRGAVVAVTDADLSYALADLDAVIAAVAGGAAVATGNRRHPQSRINLPFGLFPYLVRRWAAGSLFRALVGALFRLPVEDTQCGLKALSAEAAAAVIPRLRTRRFLADIEILVAARALGLPLTEVPVHLRYLSGGSSVRMLGGLPRTLWDLARIKLAELRGAYR